MNLARHAAVLWRFRAVTAGGLLLGVLLALLIAFDVSEGRLEPRGSEVWTSESSLLVTQPGFPEGRVTLPGNVAEPGAEAPPKDRRALEFADPARFSALATLYAQIAVSDRVRGLLASRPKPGQIQAVPVEGTPGQTLPVILITTYGPTPAAARGLNSEVIGALRRTLSDQQDSAGIPFDQRIILSALNAPTNPVISRGRSHTLSILAFLLCVLGAVAVAHILAAVRGPQPGDRLRPQVLGPVEPSADAAPVAELDRQRALG